MIRRGKVGLAVLVLCSLVSFSPILSIIASGIVADAFDCPVDQAKVYPCLVEGIDVGGPLQTMDVLGWLMFVTWPGMIVCSAAWLWLFVRRRRRARARRVAS